MLKTVGKDANPATSGGWNIRTPPDHPTLARRTPNSVTPITESTLDNYYQPQDNRVSEQRRHSETFLPNSNIHSQKYQGDSIWLFRRGPCRIGARCLHLSDIVGSGRWRRSRIWVPVASATVFGRIPLFRTSPPPRRAPGVRRRQSALAVRGRAAGPRPGTAAGRDDRPGWPGSADRDPPQAGPAQRPEPRD